MLKFFRRMKEKGESYWEFTEWLKEVNDISVNVTINTDQKRKIFNRKIYKLSDIAFNAHFDKLMKIVQSRKEDCEKFKDTESQVEAIISWLPRMKPKEKRVAKIIAKRRKSFKLKV